jgi:hypothetical protein
MKSVNKRSVRVYKNNIPAVGGNIIVLKAIASAS